VNASVPTLGLYRWADGHYERLPDSTDDQAAPLCPTIQSQPALPARDLAACAQLAAWLRW
jgi:hypothetical protein